MTSLLAIGECMMELNAQDDQHYVRAFAGDTYNTAVYAKRWRPPLKVSYLSAVGTDAISHAMVKQWIRDGIDHSLVVRSEQALPGIYAVETDENGERSFIYWRRHSAATQMMRLLQASGGAGTIPCVDYLYFSGISLAILSDEDKASLLYLIRALRSRGAKVAFDPNYRSQMWRNRNHAAIWIQRAYQCCDLVFPGLEDHKALFSQTTQAEIRDYLQPFHITEMAIKCGEQGVYCYYGNNARTHLPFEPVKNQVDSTAAGDSFAGTYLASRMMGESIAASVKAAAAVAAFVVQHRGAIVEPHLYQAFISAGGYRPAHG